MKYDIEYLKNIILDIIKEQYDPYDRGYINLYHVMPDSEDMFICILFVISYFYGMIATIFPPIDPYTTFDYINAGMIFYFGVVSVAIVIVILGTVGLYLNKRVEEKCDELFKYEIKFK
ncbi:MAG: hypothetical protein KAJ19_23820 [Gammaproteobacteria bacterium]|nr:hypothetical protein [Gammaproteobacteria bacterium]